MARITRSVAEDSVDGDYSATDLLAILASATNPDGTSYSLPTDVAVPAAADIVAGHQAFTATTPATTVITVPAGRTWRGSVSLTCAVTNQAAATGTANALGVVTTAGVGVTPAAGTYVSCEARAGGNAATGTVGSQGNDSLTVPEMVVVAPAGNAVTLAVAATIAGSNGRVACSAIGRLL
jgi:hypothetical protein